MPENPRPVAGIEARLAHKMSNALMLTFMMGTSASHAGDEPLGVAAQGAAGTGTKLKVLFGFKNGGTGKHIYTPTEGPVLFVESRDELPTLLTRPDGDADDTPIASIERGDVCIATDTDGAEILRWTEDIDNPTTTDAFRLLVSSPDRDVVARLAVIRTAAGWLLGRELYEDAIWFGHAGQPLKVPLLGTSVVLMRELTPLEHEVLIGSCVDIAIGLRPYGTAMS